MRIYIVKATTPEAETYVEEILRSIRTEPGVECKVPRRRASSAAEEVSSVQET